MAIINEVKRDWRKAIEYRKKEIERMQKLREIAKDEKPTATKRILADFNLQDIADRYDLLDIDQLRRGFNVLKISTDTCHIL